MLTKTVRSRFAHEPGEMIEGCVILEKHTVIPPDEIERRRGVYDYLVEVPPMAEKPKAARVATAPAGTGTRMTPEMHGTVIRRMSSR
ncbi:MAG TPA: hypothetical protein VKR61_23415 [Bryobacteraceae bacterium]|nr:hypothetical protein [Bryobacteraceae bacterium]